MRRVQCSLTAAPHGPPAGAAWPSMGVGHTDRMGRCSKNAKSGHSVRWMTIACIAVCFFACAAASEVTGDALTATGHFQRSLVRAQRSRGSFRSHACGLSSLVERRIVNIRIFSGLLKEHFYSGSSSGRNRRPASSTSHHTSQTCRPTTPRPRLHPAQSLPRARAQRQLLHHPPRAAAPLCRPRSIPRRRRRSGAPRRPRPLRSPTRPQQRRRPLPQQSPPPRRRPRRLQSLLPLLPPAARRRLRRQRPRRRPLRSPRRRLRPRQSRPRRRLLRSLRQRRRARHRCPQQSRRLRPWWHRRRPSPRLPRARRRQNPLRPRRSLLRSRRPPQLTRPRQRACLASCSPDPHRVLLVFQPNLP